MDHGTVDRLPLARPAGCPFDPPTELARIRSENPLVRMTFPDGHEGWLATGHALTRAILADQRFSSRYEIAHYPFPGMEEFAELPAAPVGDMTGMDAPEHTRYRSLLAGKFTVRRMRQLTDRVEQITGEHLDAMAKAGPGADLVPVYAQPIPAVMICELLGVPYAERDAFQADAAMITAADATVEERTNAYIGLQNYMQELVLAKRANPTDDMLSDLTTTDLTNDELIGLGTFLLGAGLDTTANMIALGAFALLRNPAQVPALHADPGNAVEELLRYLSIAHTGLRTALVDIELDGHIIKAGESIAISIHTANRDPRKFADPDTLALDRNAAGHLAFGHGIHQCLGQQLARVEMTVALPALFTRFPTLRLAVPPEDVPLRPDTQNIYGVERLPVTWNP